jgi:Domain of unknown function (DUF6438)
MAGSIVALGMLPIQPSPSRVDKLKSIQEVKAFIRETTGIKEQFHPAAGNPKYGNVNFIKLDIDKNGHTDLLVNGDVLYAILDKGSNNFERTNIGAFDRDFALMQILDSGANPKLVVAQHNDIDTGDNEQKYLTPDTLIYKFQGFIEFNLHPRRIEFQGLEFSRYPCFGNCPVFDLSIDKNGHALLDAKDHNKKKGKFSMTLSEQNMASLIELLSYINLEELKPSYAVRPTDFPSASLIIRYSGKRKEIHDYGLSGTFGLMQLYSKLTDLTSNENWH